jgi:hypothetical protein
LEKNKNFLVNFYNKKARADMVVDQMVELIDHYVKVSSSPDQEKIDKLFQETFPHYLGLFEALVTAQNTSFFASNQITWVTKEILYFLLSIAF